MPDPTTRAAEALADLIGQIQASPDQRRQITTDLYKALQAAGLPEPAAAALQHQIVRVADAITPEGTTDAA
jgi:hypothetical protein